MSFTYPSDMKAEPDGSQRGPDSAYTPIYMPLHPPTPMSPNPVQQQQYPTQGASNSFIGAQTIPYPPSMYPGQPLMAMPPNPFTPAYDPRFIQPPSIMNPGYHPLPATNIPFYQPGNPRSASGFFANAQNFTIGNAIMLEQYISSGAPVFQYLAKKWEPRALANSQGCLNPPRCNSDTRQDLRKNIREWGFGEQGFKGGKRLRMLWVLGFAAVGKSALAQTIADEFSEAGLLGATFFFSRPNHRDDPDTVIPTLAHQLAAMNSGYRSIITELLANDPAILYMNLTTQFNRLIIEPFHVLMTRDAQAVAKPLLIIIDGLDECRDRDAQKALIELIGGHVGSVEKFPLIWMICSRPESHLRRMVFGNISCHRETLEIGGIEAQADARRILKQGFVDIRRTFEDQLSDDWPPEHYFENIATTASGHLGFVAFIIRFVNDEQESDPVGRLERCIRFLDGFGAPGAISPLAALERLYHEIFTMVPANDLPNTMLVLAFFILYEDAKFSALQLANFLGLDQATFYRCLGPLHAVIKVPPHKEADSRTLIICHASFEDYLKDPRRSTCFCLNDDELHYRVALRSLQILKQKPGGFSNSRNLKWIRSPAEGNAVLKSLREFAKENVWEACCKTPARYFPALVKEAQGLDVDDISEEEDYKEYLRWKFYYGLN